MVRLKKVCTYPTATKTMNLFFNKTKHLAIQVNSVFMTTPYKSSANGKPGLTLHLLAAASILLISGCYVTPEPFEGSRRDSNDIIEQSQSVKAEQESAGKDDLAVPDSGDKGLELLENSFANGEFPIADWEAIYQNSLSRVAERNVSEFELLQAVPGSPFAVSIVADGEVRLWDVAADQSFFLCEIGRKFRVTALHLARALVAIGQTGSVEVYDLRTCQRVAALDKLKTRLGRVTFAPDGLSLVAAGIDGRVYRWRFAHELQSSSFKQKQLSLERYFGHSASVAGVAVHPEGRVLFSGDTDGVVNAWLTYDSDRYSGKYDQSEFGFKGHSEAALRASGRLEPAGRVEKLVVSDNGRHLLIAAQNGQLEIWKVRGFLREVSIEAHRGLIYDAIFVPGSRGSRLVTLGRDGYVRFWRLNKDEDLDTSELRLQKEVAIKGARMLAGLTSKSLLIGVKGGALLEVKLKTAFEG
jgi:WD40 repeat protein